VKAKIEDLKSDGYLSILNVAAEKKTSKSFSSIIPPAKARARPGQARKVERGAEASLKIRLD